MKYEDYKTKAGNWDYYQELLKQNGFAGITDLLTKYKQLEQVQPSPAVAVPALTNDSRVPDDYSNDAVGYRSGWNDCKQCYDQKLSTPTPPSAEQETIDARRYARLRILGAAPHGTKQLENRSVIRFQSLDDFLDADIKAHPSRGEAYTIEQPDSSAVEPISLNGLYANTCSCGNTFIGVKNQPFCVFCYGRKLRELSNTKPQRITEQDAREIFVQMGFPEAMFSEWMNRHGGKDLLDKLNEGLPETRELDYKAQRDELVNVLAATLSILESSDAIIDTIWYRHSETIFDYIKAAIAKASASNAEGGE